MSFDEFKGGNVRRLRPGANGGNNDGMSTMTREEMQAHLNASEARLEARVSRIEVVAEQIQSETSALKWWLIGTGITVVLGVASFNATVLSNMVASFESGKNTAQAIAATTQKQDEQIKKLDELITRAEKAASKP